MEIFPEIENQKIYYRVLKVEVDVRFMKRAHTLTTSTVVRKNNFLILLPFYVSAMESSRLGLVWAKNIKQMLFVIMKMDLQNLFDWHIYLRLLLAFSPCLSSPAKDIFGFVFDFLLVFFVLHRCSNQCFIVGTDE